MKFGSKTGDIMAEEKEFLIPLSVKTEIPSEAFIASEEGSFSRDTLESPGDFAAPWAQSPSGFKEAPISVSNGGLEDTQLSSGLLNIDFEGNIFIDPQVMDSFVQKNGAKKVVKKIKKQISLLPSLWEWGIEIRSEQDRILEEVRELLPTWDICLLERDRTFLNHSKIKEIKEWLAVFFKEEKTVPSGLKCSIGKISETLEKEWREIKKSLRADKEPSVEERLEKRLQKIREQRARALPILKNAGLI